MSALGQAQALIRRAVALRAEIPELSRLLESPSAALRLFDSGGDGLPGLVIERFGGALRASGPLHCATHLPAIRKAFPSDQLFWRFSHKEQGGPDEGGRLIQEGGLSYAVQLQGSRNTGLFLDARPARAWVGAHSRDRRILNLFAFTCSFGLNAVAGGAKACSNVDPVPGVLKRGRENHRLNDLPVDGRSFWREDALNALRKARRSGARFDGIILDPPPKPSGGRRGRRIQIEQALDPLLQACLAVSAPGGWLLLLAAGRFPSTAEIEARLGEPIWRGTSGADFRPQGEREPLRALAFQL